MLLSSICRWGKKIYLKQPGKKTHNKTIASNKKYPIVLRDKCFFYSDPIKLLVGLLVKYTGTSNLQPRAEKMKPRSVSLTSYYRGMETGWGHLGDVPQRCLLLFFKAGGTV